MKEGSLAQNCTEDDGSDDDDEEDDGPDETTDERIHDAAADIAMSLNIEQWVAVISTRSGILGIFKRYISKCINFLMMFSLSGPLFSGLIMVKLWCCWLF